MFDERLARLDLLAHEHGEYLVGVHGVLERDLLERAGLGVHGRLPELVRVHLAEALEAVDVDLRVRIVAAHLGRDLIALLVGESHARGLAAVELIQRWDGGVDIAAVDERAHEAEEECQQQRADVAAVDIGIGHDDDLVIAELIDVKLIAQSGAERRDDGRELVVAVDLVGAGLFDVEHLAPERQNGLEARVAPLRGRAACAVALDDVEFGERRVAVVAVAQLLGHVEALEPVFAADVFARAARGFAGARGRERFFDDHAADGGVLLQKLRQAVEHNGVDERAHLGVAELGLRLALELGVRELDGDDRRKALAAVLAGDAVALLEDAGLLAVGIERAGKCGLEAGLVHAALRRVDVVGERHDDLVIAVVILQRDLAHGVAALAGHIDGLGVQGRLVFVDEVDKFADAALVAHRLAHGLLAALIGDGDAQAGV